MNLRSLMTPKSEDEILKSLKGLSNYNILRKSIDNEFIKGIELALQKELDKYEIDLIKLKIFYTKNKEIFKILFNKVKDKLNEDQIYILEKYKLGLHQDEKKDYEIWFKEQLTDLKIIKSKIYNNTIIYKKNDEVLYINNYFKDNNLFYINSDKIYNILYNNYHFGSDEFLLLIRGMVKKYLNLENNITITIVKDSDMIKFIK
jgi:hypothetical protein